jgi:hypothetical protein
MVYVGDGALSLTDFSNILFKENEGGTGENLT